MILDIIIVILAALGALQGWKKGAVSMILSFVGLILAGWFASAVARPVGNALSIGPVYLHMIIGFLIVFLILIVLFRLLLNIVRPRAGVLRGIDSILGAVVGGLRALFMMSILFFIFSFGHLPPESVTSKSRLYSPVMKFSAKIIGIFSPVFRSTPGESEVQVVKIRANVWEIG